MKIVSAEFVQSAASPDQFPQSGLAEVAFVGRSNVGKSSLLNSLAGRKQLAKVGASPGKTRLVNFFLINGAFYLVDLPGYGYARVSHAIKKKWGALLERYLLERETLKLVVLLVDIRHPPTAGDSAMYDWLVYYNRPTVITATKVDKVSRGRRAAHLEQIRRTLGLGRDGPIIPFSAMNGEGRDELWKYIAQYVGQG